MAKYRGNIRITRETLREIIGLPEEVMVGHIEYDVERELCSFFLRSDEPVRRLTFLTGEAQEIIHCDIHSTEYIRGYIEKAIAMIHDLPVEERNEVLGRLFEREDDNA